MCVSGFTSEKVRYGQSLEMTFILFLYYVYLASEPYFRTFSTIFDFTLLILHNEMRRIGAKYLGRVGKPETHIYFFFCCLMIQHYIASFPVALPASVTECARLLVEYPLNSGV